MSGRSRLETGSCARQSCFLHIYFSITRHWRLGAIFYLQMHSVQIITRYAVSKSTVLQRTVARSSQAHTAAPRSHLRGVHAPSLFLSLLGLDAAIHMAYQFRLGHGSLNGFYSLRLVDFTACGMLEQGRHPALVS